MLLQLPIGSASKIIQFPIFDSSSTTGALLAGLVFNSASLTAYYSREGVTGAAVSITLATATKGTWATGGFIAVDGTNMPGWYELHVPDAAFASGAKSVSIHLKGATNMVPVPLLIELTATSNQNATTGGITNIDAAVTSRMATFTQPTGFLAATFPGTVASPTNITAATGVVLSGVTHTGAVIPTVTTLTGHTAQTGDNFARLGAPAGASVSADVAAAKVDTAAVKVKTDFLPSATAGAAGGVFIAGTNAATTITTSLTTTFTGNLTGSVTGAVGSVTGLTAATVHSDLDDIQARLPAALVGGRMDSNTSALNNVATAAARIALSTQGIVTATVGSASTTTSIVTSALDPAAAVTDQFKGRIITFNQATTTANLRGQSTDITASTAGGVLTVTALTTAPVSGDTFVIT